MFDDYLIISGDTYFFLPSGFSQSIFPFFGSDDFGLEDGFWLLAELCEVFLQTLLEVLFLPIKQEMLSLET